MWRWRAVSLVCLWLIDVSVATGTVWKEGHTVTNGLWDWPSMVVYHAALWLLVALLIVVPNRGGEGGV